MKQKDLIKPDIVEDGQAPQGIDDQAKVQSKPMKRPSQLAHPLNGSALKQEYDHLFLIAHPKTPGKIRPQLHVETIKRITGELAKTLTSSTLEDIEKILKASE